MGRFENKDTGVVVSVDDSKDERFGQGWEPLAAESSRKRAAAKKSESEK